MEGEKKTIRFLQNHVEIVGRSEFRFRRDEAVEIGDGHDIDEKTARDLIRQGIALPGFSHGKSIPQKGPGKG